MAGISQLLETLREENDKPLQIAASLRADSSLKALRKFLSVLRSGIRTSENGKLGFQNWTRNQIDATVSVSGAIVAASVPILVDEVDLVVLSIVRDSIELCTCLLEKFAIEGDDASLQNSLIEVLEIALIDGKQKGFEMGKISGVTVEETLPFPAIDLEPLELDNFPSNDSPDIGAGLESHNSVDSVLMLLSIDFLKGSSAQSFTKSLTSILHLSQRWAVINIKCVSRLLMLLQVNFLPSSTRKQLGEDTNFHLKLSLSSKLLRLLGNLVKDRPVLDFNADLLSTVASIADSLPKLFKIEMDLADCELSHGQNNFWGLLLNLLDDFHHFVKFAFCGSIVYHNVRTSMVAAILGALDSNTWRYDSSGSCFRSPVVYFPQIVMYLLRLIGEVKNQKCQLHNPIFKYESHSFSCLVDSKEVFLLQSYMTEEHLRIIFPSSRQWVDDLLHLAYFLHSEGLRCRTKTDRIILTCMKSNVSDLESTASLEEDAIFGDLFSEASRPDGNDQLPVVPVITSSSHQMPFTAAAIELLNFLKLCVFSPDWDSKIFSDACRKFSERHIDYLLSMLLSQTSTDDKTSHSSTGVFSPGSLSHSNEICFELLRNLLEQRVLFSSLEEYLVDKILTVSNGKYVYNDQTLALLAHSLISNTRSSGSHLARRVFEAYCNFIITKTKDVLSGYPELTDLAGSLPHIFHIEIILMAFHLCDEAEKTSLAKNVLVSLREISRPSDECSQKQLSCWALLVSRLVLVLRHLVLHPSTCPLWLLLSLRSKLGVVPSSARPSFPHTSIESCFYRVSIEAGNVLGDQTNELPILNILLPHLIDVTVFPHPPTYCRNYGDFQVLGLDFNEMAAPFLSFLGFWSGRSAETIADLLLERYIFMLCWDTCLCVGSFGSHTQFSLMTESFLKVGNLLLNSCSFTSEGSNPAVEIIKELPQLFDCNVEPGWNFLRNGSWLSIVLSLINAGAWMHSVRYNLPGFDSWAMSSQMDSKFLNAAEGMITSINESGKIGWLLSILSSCLKQQLQILQEAFLSVIHGGPYHCDGFSYVLLFKHVLADGQGQNDILEKCGGFTSSQLTSVISPLLRLDHISSMQNIGVPARVLYRCLLHGFPSHSSIYSGLLLSCVLTVRDIICAVNGLLIIKSAGGDSHLDTVVIHEMMESLTSIKSDMIFRHIHGKCDSIFSSLSPSFGGNLDYVSLYELNYLLGALSDFNCHGAPENALHEALIMEILNKAECLRKDQSRADIFEFFLGTEETAHQHFVGRCFTFQVLVTAIEKCSSEVINQKVLSFLINILTGIPLYLAFREALQKRFLSIDLLTLSLWLEKRLLGHHEKSPGAVTSNESCSALRELTTTFLSCLISPSNDVMSEELRDRFVEAMLFSLKSAFTLYDLNTAKAFFTSLVQLLGGQSVTKKFLEKILVLIEELAGCQKSLQHLKFLFSFLRAVLGDPGISKGATPKLSKKLSSISSFGVDPLTTRLISRKNPEALAPPCNQETDSTNMDCDATSGEDDEEDGTSDGEMASIDKDDDDDNNSERSLASKLCTFTSSGNTFIEQHWYFCYTCDLTVSKGCCSVCAKVCHRGHRVVYSRSSRFFCDCGAGGVRGSGCLCLKPRKFTGSSNSVPRYSSALKSLLPLSEDGDQALDSDSDMDGDTQSDVDCLIKFSIPRDVFDVLPILFEAVDTEKNVIGICRKLNSAVIRESAPNLSPDKKVILGPMMTLTYSTDVFQLKKTFKSGSLDLKIKADYTNSRDLKSHLANGSLVKSLLSVSTRGRLAVGEGDKIAIFDASQLIGQSSVVPVTADKSSVKPLSRNTVRFEIVNLVFNPIVDNYLAIAGYEECQVLTLNSRGEITDRLAIELALNRAYIRRVDWVPGSQVHLMVVTNMFVKIYDLSQDNMSPAHYFTLKDDTIMDASLVSSSSGNFCVLVLSELGSLFRLDLSIERDVGMKSLTEVLHVQGRESQSKGRSLYFSHVHRLLFLSYQDGTTLIGRIDAGGTALTEISSIHEEKEEDGQTMLADLHHWRELIVDHVVFVCFSCIKSNAALAVSFEPSGLVAQSMRYVSGPILPWVGITAYKPLSKDKAYCLVLQDDGSLQIYSHASVSSDMTENLNIEKAKKLGAGILSSKGYASMNTDFPVDFFEKTICITGDIKLSGEAIKNNDSEAIKQKLQSEDGFLECPNPSGFKITVSNLNPDITMVGIRVQVGNSSMNHIPSEIKVFQRVIKLDEGMRSWYDIPFTTSEALVSDEEFTVSIGPTFDELSSPRIDSLEIYGQSKEDFGWKQKMESVLNLESHALGVNYNMPIVQKKCQTMQSASVQEQVLAEALNLLSRFYISCRPWSSLEYETANLELGKVKCKDILENIFQNDCERLLQAAASRVLKAIFPRKEVYHHVKDTMRLEGVINALPKLKSRIGVGGAATGLVIKEFMARLHDVSRIALHRRSNLVSFLATHGSEVMDKLMDVLLGILDLERPDTHTINNIVVPSVDLIYCYADCLTVHESASSGALVAPAVILLKKLLLSPYETVQTSSSLAISSRLLQVPFPKQIILPSTDDASENPSSTNMPSDASNATGGNANVLIEEDGNLSSVQYCCDGCSTVPILRRRWHCNVCPDFDLCETCYELMDSEHLPPPHSKDHPMSAIPIEIDSVGGEGRGVLFTMDELTGATLINAQNSSSSINILDSNESGDFPPVDQQRFVSISASKRAVNSFLLQQLIAELKGWMEGTSGLRAIPIMQLFYRLFSSVNGPFMDSSKPESLDLEKVVKWFLDEINLNQPFVTQGRSSFGEICILIFMFFTLMLRNWHQPGGESSQVKPSTAAGEKQQEKGFFSSSSQVPKSSILLYQSSDEQDKNEFVSQLTNACSSLRQQSFVNYLMDILQQLVSEFKSSRDSNADNTHGSSGSSLLGCGSLLTIRKELPTGNYLPFFSDSYAKAHKTDLFADYHRLLVENTFRLVYGLVRPEKNDKGMVKEKTHHRNSSIKELKLDGYQDILCAYICNPYTTFVRRYARRLLLHLCGSKTQYYQVRDLWLFSNEVRKLYKLGNKLGHKSTAFQSSLAYEQNIKLVKSLTALSEVAGARPRNWQKYCIKNGEILSFLMDGVFYFGEESVIQTLKLLNLAFYNGRDVSSSFAAKTEVEATSQQPSSADLKKKRKGDDVGSESNSDKTYLDMDQAVTIFCTKEGAVLQRFIDSFLLEWNTSSLRSEAKNVLYGVWHHGKKPFQETLLSALLDKIKILPRYGRNAIEYTELLITILGKPHESEATINQCLTPDVIKCIYKTLHSQNDLLANHPNSRIYSTLGGLVEFDGYYLESDPCLSCSCPEVPYTRMKLESLKAETKFTDNRIIVKCTGSHSIQTVSMNVHDARKSRSVKVLNLYYNNTPVADLSELKNNWSMWKRAKSCHLAFNQTELKVDFPIPITACNFMIELNSFYESLQASSLESLQCPRCSRSVTDKHGICSHCHENAYQCRQCRNINYENLNSFLCNECGYSKYGRFEFNFMAKPSFTFDDIENDEEMKKVLATIESESENAHRRYQQLLGFKKPMLKLLSSIGEHEIESASQQKEAVQQLVVSLPGPSCKINRKIAILGVLYGEKCKGAFDSVSKSVQMLQGLRQILMNYLNKKSSCPHETAVTRLANNCYGCAATFAAQCMELLHVLSKKVNWRKQLVGLGILSELFENNIHQGPKSSRSQARAVLCAFSEGDSDAVAELNGLIQRKVMYCLEHHRSMDISQATREELFLLSEACSLVDEFWEARLRVAFKLLFSSIKFGAKHPAISEYVILPCLRIVSQACTPPKIEDNAEKKEEAGKSATKKVNSSIDSSELGLPLLSYSEWEKGATYLDFVRRQYRISQVAKFSKRSRDYLALKYAIRWKRVACRRMGKTDFSSFELGSWISELILSACSQSIRVEVCSLFTLLCPENSCRQFQLLVLLINLLPGSVSIGDSAAEYFELFFKMIESEAARLFLTSRGCLSTLCKLVTKEVNRIDSQERRLNVDISQGFVLHKLVELLSKFLEVPTIRIRFMRAELISQVLEAFLVLRGLILQKTKLISDCNRLLKELIDGLLLESSENKRLFIRACISGLQVHSREQKRRTSLFILEQLCNVICPSKLEPVYLLNLNKAHTQEEFIRGSMTKNPYSSNEIGQLMRDVKNKICNQLDLLGLLEDDYGMELLVAGSIISLDLSIAQVYEQVWKKSCSQSQNAAVSGSALISSSGVASSGDLPPMTVTYRLQGLDGEATEPMIKELDEDREESQDPEVEFAIAGAVRECSGLEVMLSIIQKLGEEGLKSNEEELMAVLNLLIYCCKIRENRRALLRIGALSLLLDTARRAFAVDSMEPAESLLLIVESLSIEANDSNLGITSTNSTHSSPTDGQEAKKIILMFLERLSHKPPRSKSHKQQRKDEMVARILPYLTYSEPAAMEALIDHFDPYLRDWASFDILQLKKEEDEKAEQQRSAVDNFVRLSESLRTSSCGERLKDMILDKGLTSAAIQHLAACFTNSVLEEGLGKPSVPVILSMLRGICRGHHRTQECIEAAGILPLLHALERVPGENEIGTRAENLLDTLSDKDAAGDGFLGDQIFRLRHATREELRRRALLKRQQLLQGMGMKQEVGKIVVVARPSIMEGMEDVEEEEDGLACMVCREGYSLRPGDALGVYSYTKRVSLGGATRGDCVYTTVSHFNVIHFQCHHEAKRADAALKNPKKEWDGAALRNNETLCNSVFPIKGPALPSTQYARYLDQHWENLAVLGRADGSRLRLLSYDIVLMLARFATGASFSSDSRGGGKESNARFLPFMIQMATELLDQPASSRRSLARSISTYLSSDSMTTAATTSINNPSNPTNSPEETVQFMMVTSLLADSYQDWSRRRLPFLRRGLRNASPHHHHHQDESALFATVKPILVYVGLVEQLQRFFKLLPRSSEDGWEMVMKEKLVNVKEMVGFSKEFLLWLEDMTASGDLQEAMDVMGMLGDVLSSGSSTCLAFVQSTISSPPAPL